MKSQFSYCPLVLMFCSRQTNMINKLHERALRLVLNDHVSDFEALLRKSNDISCHHRNIQMPLIELCKIKNELASPIMDSMLNRRNITYNFRNLQKFQSEKKRTVFNGLETLSYRAPQLWTLLPEEIKQRNTINLFTIDVKQWICKEWPCRLQDCIVLAQCFFLLNKIYMIHLTERYMFNNNNKAIEALQRYVGPFMLILLLLSSLVCFSCLVFDMYFSTVTCFFNLVLSILSCSFVLWV